MNPSLISHMFFTVIFVTAFLSSVFKPLYVGEFYGGSTPTDTIANKTQRINGLDIFCNGNPFRYHNGGTGHFAPIVHCPYVEYSDSSKIPSFVIDQNDKYLTDRMGKDFFEKRVIFRNYIVIEPARFDELRKQKGYLNLEMCDSKVKYAFEYYIVIDRDINFYFTTVYDSVGNLLSSHQTPNVAQNKHYDVVIDVCKAKQIADSNQHFKGEVKDISLEYEDAINSFVWVAEKPHVIKGGNFTGRFIVINAQTGKIVRYFNTYGLIDF